MTIELETASAAADPDQVRAALSRYKEAFDAQGADAARRMDEIEAKAAERLARLEQGVAEQKARAERREVERARPPLALSKAESDPLAAEHKSAFDAYFRSGESAGLKTLEAKALSAGSGPDGGYLVPSTIEREVLRRLGAVSPIRAIASVRAISGGLYM